jgi:uncharacterized protein with HEPN domain
MAASRSARIRLLHIRDEIEGVAAAVKGLSFEQYRAELHSPPHRRACRTDRFRGREGVAARSPRPTWQCSLDINYWDYPAAEYQRLDDRQLWEIATVHLPALEPVVSQMLAELDN